MILITGGNGQLGTELRYYLDELKIDYVSTDSSELDITDSENTRQYINELKPEVIFHCAAYTVVDKAEDEGKEINYQVNVEGTRNVALAAKETGAVMVYISTDYVFDGTLVDGEYSVDAKTNPQNEYGKAKLQGEESVKEILDTYYIVRTSWVYGNYGNNFVFTMQKLAKNFDTLTVVNDQFGRPTWTRTLTEFMVYLINQKADYGTYHLANDNSCTWFEFAKEILKDEQNLEIKPVTSEEFPQKAKRPKSSILNLDETKNTGFEIPTWQDALNSMLERQ